MTERDGQSVLVELLLGEDAQELDAWEVMAVHEEEKVERQSHKRAEMVRRQAKRQPEE